MISDEAVEAALAAYYERGGLTFASAHPDTRASELVDMREALEAAAPHMQREADASNMLSGAWQLGHGHATLGGSLDDDPYRSQG